MAAGITPREAGIVHVEEIVVPANREIEVVHENDWRRQNQLPVIFYPALNNFSSGEAVVDLTLIPEGNE